VRLESARLPEGCTALGVPDPHRCDHYVLPPRTAGDLDEQLDEGGVFKDGVSKSRPAAILYLSFDGVVLTAGNDDPAEGTSSVLGMQGVQEADLPPFDHSGYSDLSQMASRKEAVYAVAGLVRYFFAPYDVEVVVERPPDTIPYTMCVVGGDVSQLNLPGGVLGVSPMDCNDSNPQNINFVFAEEMASSVVLALTIAHEVGHAYGLVHIDDTEAIMNPYQASQQAYWLEGTTADDLACDGSASQDSYALLGENMSWRVTNGAPWVELVYPRQGAVVGSLTQVIAQTADESVVERLELLIDGVSVATAEWPEMVLTFGEQPAGEHTIELIASDSADHNGEIQTYTATVDVTVDPGCSQAESCRPGLGAVGQICESSRDCASGVCVEEIATGNRVCSKTCSVESPCPWPLGSSQQGVQWTRCLCDDSDPGCCVPEPEECADGKDNDCDGLVDCADSDCESGRMCTGMEVCANDIDDDVDGITDCADPDCALAAGCGCVSEIESCDNREDDDCDGEIDCADADCAVSELCTAGPTASPKYCGTGEEPVKVYSGAGSGSSGGRKLSGCRAAGYTGPAGSHLPVWMLALLGLLLWPAVGRARSRARARRRRR
jgi:hypothetical protein